MVDSRGQDKASDSKRNNDNTHREIMLAGAFAAFTVDLLVYPLDTIKTRMQSRDYIKTYAETSNASSKPIATAKAFRRVTAPSAYALRGLYQGIGTVILVNPPRYCYWAKRIVGSALPAATNAIAPGSQPPAALIHALSSGMAELASCLVLTPAEVIKQNAQMIKKSKATASGGSKLSSASTSLQAFRMLAHAEGGAVRRLLAGYTALAARNLPFTALQFPMFEALRARFRRRWAGVDSSDPTSRNHLLFVGAVNGFSAGTSGAVAAVITTPLDVVKTRMMLSPYDDDAGKKKTEDKTNEKNKPPKAKRFSAVQLARRIYREHGIRGLFRGGAFRAGWTFVGSGLYLGTYEVAKAYLRGGRQEGDGDGGI
ncbi:mitochondrial carrier protein [Sporothrix schenckii 1099-18]|uniref:Mitochondrial carrier protein n=1 Tax=Sporothrix schenckii 1099-18 TaxID=1397361 RepID=A0A0F2MER1_SPOSC|nr:mitochondrial carrier protein [Sporothrix schenckii 1099-18]KJR88173.1 mitochondrial carrier protein [Sporothrix schenckii 1099-18]